MRFHHPDHPGRFVRLAYCMNVHPAETLEELEGGLTSITLPLRDRLAGAGRFGIGMYFAADLAARLRAEPALLEDLAKRLDAERLDPFTFNAFPYGGFHTDGLKADVYRPTWAEPERATFTRDVLHVAEALWVARATVTESHLSISTHPGTYGAWLAGPAHLHELSRGFLQVRKDLLEASPLPVVLSLEAEPRASSGDQRELAEFLTVLRVRAGEAASRFGTCLDCCHAAVEFEDPEEAVKLATFGGPLGKLQFSSALALEQPGASESGRAALLALDEPRYLHQVTPSGSARGVSDLNELPAALEADPAWLSAEEWRCHFHVPVDLDEAAGLTTTRAHAEATLSAALSDPERWGVGDLHVEIETYTWDVLPSPARGAGDLVDGLEREYHAAIAVLEGAGWKLSDSVDTP